MIEYGGSTSAMGQKQTLHRLTRHVRFQPGTRRRDANFRVADKVGQAHSIYCGGECLVGQRLGHHFGCAVVLLQTIH